MFLLLIVLVPLLEIAVFVQVAAWIGVLDAIGVLVLFSVGGLLLVRHEGMGTLGRIRAELNAGRVPTAHLVDGGLLLVAGLLLLIPGFITDLAGLLLLLPPVRGLVKLGLARRFRVQTIARTPQPPPDGTWRDGTRRDGTWRGRTWPDDGRPDDGRPEILP